MDDEIEEMVIVRKNKESVIVSGWTSDDALEVLGSLELAKHHVIEELRD
ncbi:hypothetical protein ACLNAR_26645 [Priestia aryabhattai]